MFGIKSKIKLMVFKRKWAKDHPGSFPMSYFDPKIVSMGKWSYGELNITSFNNKSHLNIGTFVSIAQNVNFLLDAEHNIDTVSQYPFKVKVLGEVSEAWSKGDIVVKDDVWIGFGATILSGITIHQGAVVAAGSVVTSDVEPYSVVGGVPAKRIKYRFDKNVIDYLMTLDYSALTEELVKQNIEDLYKPIKEMELEEIKKLYSWFPKKEKGE